MAAHIVTVALVGNPNAGKTTLFNALSGLRQRVGNYPGVTVEMKKGKFHHGDFEFDLIDLPGTYSLAARSPDEMVAVDLLLGHRSEEPRPNVIVSIVDASNLDRHLYLTSQVMETGVPVVVALNMMDTAQAHGLSIQVDQLSQRLGVPVVPIQANRHIGLAELQETLARVSRPAATIDVHGVEFPAALNDEVGRLCQAYGVEPFLARRLLLDVQGYIQESLTQKHGPELTAQVNEGRGRLAAAGHPVAALEARARYAWIRGILKDCVERPAVRPVTWTDKLDKVLTHKVWGTVVFLALMFVVFQSIFSWARPLMGVIESGKDLLGRGVGRLLEPGPLRSLLQEGVIDGVGGVVIFLPQILILFAFIAVLEDCGYMARAAFLMDRLMARCGLSGKSFIPMLSSVACAIPGIMATRVIENRRDRLATILVAPLMSCSARLPVYVLLIGAFIRPGRPWWVGGLTMFAMYCIGLVTAPLMALALKRTLLRGATPVFVMEMPLYKRPSLRTVLHRVFDAGWSFVRRAGTLILASMILVWALLYFPRTGDHGGQRDRQVAEIDARLEQLETQIGDASENQKAVLEDERNALEDRRNAEYGEWKRQSALGRMGRAIEPVVRPLGWDWRIGMAALASFPAREVVVGTLGIIYNQGSVDAGELADAADPSETKLGRALRAANWDGEPDRPVFTVPAALSLMVFFALCCQCVSTLAVIRRETKSWVWPTFTFGYMTVLAYIGTLVTYQVGTWLAG